MGKHAKITYTVKAIADIAKKADVNKEEQFLVMNTYNNKIVSPGSNISFNKENKSYTISTNTLEDENNISALQ